MEGGSESEETQGQQCWGPTRMDWIRSYTSQCSWFPATRTSADDLKQQLMEHSSFKQWRATGEGLENQRRWGNLTGKVKAR